MIALREIEVNGGTGQVIDLSLLEPILSVIGADAAIYKAAGVIPRRLGSRSNITARATSTRPRRPLDLDLGLHAVHGRAALCRRRRARDDQRPALCRQQRASRPCRRSRAAGGRVHRRATTAPRASPSSRPPRSRRRRSTTSTSSSTIRTCRRARSWSTCPTRTSAACRCTTSYPVCRPRPAPCAGPPPTLGEHTAEVLGARRPRRPRAHRAPLREDRLMRQPETRPARLALPAVRAHRARPVRRQGAHARRRRRSSSTSRTACPRPRRTGRARSCRRLPRRCARAAPTCWCASTALAPGLPRHRGLRRPRRHGAGVPQGGEPRASRGDRGAARHLEAARGLPAGHTKLFALVETADAYFRMREIAKATPRLVAMSLGAEDFALSVGMEPLAETLQSRSRRPSSPPAPPASCPGVHRHRGRLPGHRGLPPGGAPLTQVRLRRRHLHPPGRGARAQRGVRRRPPPPSIAPSA